MNRRSYIKKYVADVMESISPDYSIYVSRRTAVQDMELPAIAVAIDSERSEVSAQSEEVKKTAELSIEVIVDTEGKVDLELDDMTAAIEDRFYKDGGFNQTIDRCILRQTDIAIIREGEMEYGIARMVFDVSYYSNPKPTKLDHFEGAVLHFQQRLQA